MAAFRRARNAGYHAQPEGKRDNRPDGFFKHTRIGIGRRHHANLDRGTGAVVLLENRNVLDRRQSEELAFNIGTGDFHAAHIQDIGAPANQFQPVWRDHGAEIARIEPAVPEHFRGRHRIADIAVDNGDAANADGADLAGGQSLATRTGDFDLDPFRERGDAILFDSADDADLVRAIGIPHPAGEFRQGPAP
jgi:hypothetical protein